MGFGSTAWTERALALAAVLAPLSALAQQPGNAADDAWPVVGRQGIVQLVIVPSAHSREREAYTQQIKRLCQPDQTCFLNFYTNSTGAELVLPLPDAVSHEATAVFRRSTKQGAELFRWSCRMGNDEGNCF